MTSKTSRAAWLAAAAGALAISIAAAQEPATSPAQPNIGPRAGEPGPQPRPLDAPNQQLLTLGQQLPMTPLAALVERVARTSNKQFLIDLRARPQVYTSGIRPEDVTYPILLSILRANYLAAVTIEGRVNIVPIEDVRSYPLPLVQQDDRSIAADEWVTRIVTLNNVEAAQLVPILRPLLPQFAHLSALPPKKLIIVDRYANVQRMMAIIKSLDE
jgi:general secretion pathway protein D